MVPVGGKLWCGSQNRVLVINTATLAQEVRTGHDQLSSPVLTPPPLTPLPYLSPLQHWFQVGTDSSRCVTCMVAYGQGVWLALQGSAHVRLYHAQSCESLTEVDVAPAVHKMLAGQIHFVLSFSCQLPQSGVLVAGSQVSSRWHFFTKK